jgi:hypothetical protein
MDIRVLALTVTLELKHSRIALTLGGNGSGILDYEKVTLTVKAVVRPIQTVAVIHNPSAR